MCWIFHKWGKWQEAGRILSTEYDGRKRVVGLVQERVCEICNRLQHKEWYL